MDQGPDLIRDLLILEGRATTGQLEVASDGVHTLLYFVDGQLVYAEGGTLTDTLGRLLTREGTLTREQYVDVLQHMTDALVEHEEMRFGEVAIGLGYASPQQVTEGLTRQVRSRLLGCLQHERSERCFDEGSSYTGRVPRFPVEIGPAILAGLHSFYDEERLYPLLMLSLERRWRLRNPADLGSARFAFSRDELQVVRRLKEPTRLADLLGDPATVAPMRVALLLWLAGLVEDVEPLPVEISRAHSERPPLERPLQDDLVDRTLPSLRPPAFMAPEPAAPPVEAASSEPLTPSSKAIAADLARARVLKGLAGASGGARPVASARVGAVDAIAALRERQKGGTPAATRTSTMDPRVDAETYFHRGRVDLDQGRLAAARQHFENAYAGHPSDEYGLYLAWARFLTADTATVVEQRETVESRMMDCLRTDRRMAFAHYIAGRLALIDEEFEAAEKAFKRAVSFDEHLTDAARSLRLVQQRLGTKK